MNDSRIRIITTSDGSHSLYNEELRETYHPTHGALTESLHVFIKEGINYLRGHGVSDFSILEVGFGTGLNALLVWDYCRKNPEITIHFETLEPFPLTSDLFEQLNYVEAFETSISHDEFLKMHQSAWGENLVLESNFSFVKHKTPLLEFKSDQLFNLVFYDAFAPSKQSEMWDIDSLGCINNVMDSSSTLVTYCAQGQFKRNLAQLGLSVETLDGPPGKKEMVRANKTQ